MTNIKTIYFSHSVKDYNTEYELNIINQIKTKYPDTIIINPKDIIIDKEDLKSNNYPNFMKLMQKYYFPEIDKCDLMIVAKSRSGKYGPGVQKELSYMNAKAIYNNIVPIPIKDLSIPYPSPNRQTLICHKCKKQFIPKENIDYEVEIRENLYHILCWYCITGEDE